MKLRYEIEEETNAVKIFYNDSIIPSLYQPHFPSGEVWIDAEEATMWAELYIAAILDESAPFAPDARGKSGTPKLTAEEKIELQQKLDLHYKSLIN